MKKLALIVLLGGMPLCVAPSIAEEDAYKIVVHPSNPATQISRSDLAAIFLKKAYRWSEGPPVLPVEPRRTSPVRERFSIEVHGRPVSAIVLYWNQQIFSGKAVPPPEKATDVAIVAFVKANPGSIGYVAASADASGAKVLTIKD